MALKVGNTTIKKVNVVKDGKTTALKKLYVGDVLVWKAESDPVTIKTSSNQGAIGVTTTVTYTLNEDYTNVIFTDYTHPTIYGKVTTTVKIGSNKIHDYTSEYNGEDQAYSGSRLTKNTSYSIAKGTTITLTLYQERANSVSSSTDEVTANLTFYFT